MKMTSLQLQGAYLFEPVVHGDHRGFFMESYNGAVLEQQGITLNFIQDNHSMSAEPGVIRGLHYQSNPKAQTKLVRAVRGAIYDVIVDVRRSSPTFGQWVGVILSEYNHRQLLVPKGFAHGFCTVVPNTQVVYKVDEYYSSEHDRGILWNDSELGIDWPASNPVLSDKDQRHPQLKDAELNFD
ncbi:dTDP-4-dehydrorhamnose 3,5-epimerase [Paenibacillus sp.]|jgi:dTDP-4-dehydrorhamnose 3,5-epimerase|uniref:dTDP-4-dehydrorhamnose 3,5-epimerase n=1 Tax=Paenibacillus sp. TaxID=58172 RepID=UPI0028258282|nr:dTDP-4-dehydrorhamnose 3,5-epimerase [Paenibacillus sp.]MDR0271202.1 dTDP-4-dehydrorhamnose 3,5-epimerase [Paenibacillus sp.]